MWKNLLIFQIGLSSFQGILSVPLDNSSGKDVCSFGDSDIAADACAMKSAFGGSSVFPEIFPDFQPVGALYVQYGNVIVGGAQQLSPSRVFAQPLLRLALVDSLAQKLGINPANQKYTVACIDFQKTSGSHPLIWLQAGLVANPQSGILSSSTKPTLPYTSPYPSAKSGAHEYVFFVFKENSSGTNLGPGDSNSGIVDLKTLTSRLQLDNNLVAASYFKSQYDGQPIPDHQSGDNPTKQTVVQQTAANNTSNQPSSIKSTQVVTVPSTAKVSTTSVQASVPEPPAASAAQTIPSNNNTSSQSSEAHILLPGVTNFSTFVSVIFCIWFGM